MTLMTSENLSFQLFKMFYLLSDKWRREFTFSTMWRLSHLTPLWHPDHSFSFSQRRFEKCKLIWRASHKCILKQSTEFILKWKRYKMCTKLNIISDTIIIMHPRNDCDASVCFGSYSLDPCLTPFHHLLSLSLKPTYSFLPIQRQQQKKWLGQRGATFWPCKSICLPYLLTYLLIGTGFPYLKETMGFQWKMTDGIKVE